MKRLLPMLIVLLAAVAALAPASAASASGVCPTADTASTYVGTHLTTGGQITTTVIQSLYNAGFTSGADLLAGTAIPMAESSMWTQARNWHPDYHCRPATDYIGVQGPASVWSSDHTQQLHSDRGLWQISSHSWPQYNDHITDAPGFAAGAVVDIHAAQGWNAWDTYKSGAAQAHYDAAVGGFPAVRPLVEYFCSFHACT
jgi:hypothetical protein